MWVPNTCSPFTLVALIPPDGNLPPWTCVEPAELFISRFGPPLAGMGSGSLSEIVLRVVYSRYLRYISINDRVLDSRPC